MQNLELFPYVHLHTTTFRVWKNNIEKKGGGGLKIFLKRGRGGGGGIKEGGWDYLKRGGINTLCELWVPYEIISQWFQIQNQKMVPWWMSMQNMQNISWESRVYINIKKPSILVKQNCMLSLLCLHTSALSFPAKVMCYY